MQKYLLFMWATGPLDKDTLALKDAALVAEWRVTALQKELAPLLRAEEALRCDMIGRLIGTQP